MRDYLDLCKRVVEHGEWVLNERTGKRCLTVINADFTYDVSDNKVPVLTTKELYWKPAIAEMLGYLRGYTSAAEINRACLASCMHTHTFSILNNKLYLTSYQRSDDLPLGHGFNQVQVAWLLLIMAQITGLKPGKAFHKIVNAHIYEDQLLPMVSVQLQREPMESPTLKINPDIKTLKDLETWVTLDDFELINYIHYPPIEYAFSE